MTALPRLSEGECPLLAQSRHLNALTNVRLWGQSGHQSVGRPLKNFMVVCLSHGSDRLSIV